MTVIITNTDYDERIVKVEVKMRRAGTSTRYAIYDAHLGYWRGTSALTDYDAWTRDTGRRATFKSRSEAYREWKAIRRWRREREGAAAAASERMAA
jgi:hypothetical protein